MKGSRRLRWMLGLLFAGWLTLSLTCSPEETVGPGDSGHFQLVLRFPTVAVDSSGAFHEKRAEPGSPDSVRLVVTDASGRALAREASGIDSEGRFRLEVDLRVGGPYSAIATVESQGTDPRAPSVGMRAGLYLGTLGDIRIEPGEITRDTIAVRSLLTNPSLIQGQVGDLDYTISWNPVEGAEAYDLVARAEPSGAFSSWETPETTRVFDLAEVKRMLRRREAAGGGSEAILFWVRARTRWTLGHFDDSLLVPVGDWKGLPRVTEVLPANGDPDVPDTAIISLRFTQPMDTLDLRGAGIEVLRRDGTPFQELRRDIDADGAGLSIIPQGFLPNEKEIEIRVSTSVRDFEGKPLDQDPEVEGLQEFTSGFTVEPYLWLRVSYVNPPDGAQGVERRPVAQLALTRPVDESTVTESVLLSDSLGRTPGFSVGYVAQDTTLSVTVLEDLPWGTLHTLRVTPSLLDLRGRTLDQDPETAEPDTFATSFRVAPQPESPQVASVDPAPGAANVLITSVAVVTFSRTVKPETVTPNSFAIRKPPIFANIPGTIEHAGDSLTFTFRPSAHLERGLGYRIAVTTTVTDPEGDPLDQDRSQEGYQDFVSEFRSEDNPVVLEISPDQVENVDVLSSFTLTFSKPLDSSTVDESSVYIERVESGDRVASTVGLSGGDRVSITPQDSLRFITTYRIWAATSIQSDEGSQLDQDLDTPQHDPYSFTFTTEFDSTPPRVTEVSPPDGAADVSESTQVIVTFENPIKPSTVYEQTFVLARIVSPTDSILVSGSIDVAADSVQAFLTPDGPLEFESLYRIRVKRFVSSPFGILLDQDPETPGEQEFVSEFTTKVESISPTVASVVPADSSDSVPLDADVVVTFDEPMRPETIPGAFSLLKDDVAVSGTGVVSTDSLQWTFTPSMLLDLLTEYAVVVDTTAMDRVGNPLDQRPETPGLQPFTSVFTTVTDSVGPRVTEVDPADGADSVSVFTSVTLTFSEPVDPLTVGTSTFQVAPEGGEPLSGTLEVLEGNDQARWTPAEALVFSTSHEVTATSGIKDLFGNGLDQDPATEPLDPFMSSFTTQPETLSPRVESLIVPEIPVPVDAILAVVFNEPVDPQTIAPGGVDLLLEDVPANLIRWVSDSGDTAFVQPDPDLLPESVYTFRVSPSVTDTVGNPLDQSPEVPGFQPFEAEFWTGQDNKPPRVLSVTPADDSTGLGASPQIQLVFSEILDPTTVDATTLLLTPESGTVAYIVTLLADGQTALVELMEDLRPETIYTIEATHDIRDVAGNGLDQDPETPDPETFISTFTTGMAPNLALPEGSCQVGDSAFVAMDASGSSDPDGEVVSVVWDWGDGSVDTLAAPGGLEAVHTYPCTDAAGCDSLDNDGDGLVDETGPEGCDESYKIVITLFDNDGFSAHDTTGVSFCDFRIILSDPPDGATDVSPLTDIILQFSRPALPGSLNSQSVILRVLGGETVATVRTLTDGGRRLILTPLEELMFSTDYEVVVTTDVVSEDGEFLDQEPCTPDPAGWLSSFRTAPR